MVGSGEVGNAGVVGGGNSVVASTGFDMVEGVLVG